MTTVNLNTLTSTEKKTIHLQEGSNENLTFTGDIEGQVQISENGSDIVVTAYGIDNITYEMGERTYSGVKNNGKYFYTETVYDVVVDSYGNVSGYIPTGTERTGWTKDRVDGNYYYQIINGVRSRGILTDITEYIELLDYGKTINPKKILVQYTYKNVQNANELLLYSYDYIGLDLKTCIYEPVKKGNKYTGTFLNEEVDSTYKNETFALGTGDDRVNFDLSVKQGKDTIIVSNGQNLYLDLQNGDDLEWEYNKRGNNLVVDATRYYDNTYNIKAIVSISSKCDSWGEYNIGIKAYDYNYETQTYNKTADVNVKKGQGLVATSGMLEAYGLKTGKTYTVYLSSPYSAWEIQDKLYWGEIQYITECITDYTTTTPVTKELISQITLKNYFKNGTLENVTGYNFNPSVIIPALNSTYDRRGATKNQTINDTNLDEILYGGEKNDKITSSGGDDRIEGGKGNDTIMLGSGNKDIYYKYGDGSDTIINAQKSDSIMMNINNASEFVGYHEYTKSGNNLIINHSYFDESQIETTEKTTIKDFFKNENYNNTNITININETLYSQTYDLTDALTLGGSNGGQYVQLDYKNDKKIKSITGSDLSDIIRAGEKTTTIMAQEGNNYIRFHSDGKAISATAGNGNDHYDIYKNTVSHDIIDKGGNDEIVFTYGLEADHYILLFDVIANGAAADKNNDLEALHIICKDNYGTNDMAKYIAQKGTKGLLNTANIRNFFTKDGEAGSGRIEGVCFLNNSKYDFSSNSFNSSELNDIRSTVASWLAENNYQSAMSVITSQNSQDISTLLNMYTLTYNT